MKGSAMKKGRALVARPKSREETPKEGMNREAPVRTPIYAALHKCQDDLSNVPIR
jgi:hypothetical protein